MVSRRVEQLKCQVIDRADAVTVRSIPTPKNTIQLSAVSPAPSIVELADIHCTWP